MTESGKLCAKDPAAPAPLWTGPWERNREAEVLLSKLARLSDQRVVEWNDRRNVHTSTQNAEIYIGSVRQPMLVFLSSDQLANNYEPISTCNHARHCTVRSARQYRLIRTCHHARHCKHRVRASKRLITLYSAVRKAVPTYMYRKAVPRWDQQLLQAEDAEHNAMN